MKWVSEEFAKMYYENAPDSNDKEDWYGLQFAKKLMEEEDLRKEFEKIDDGTDMSIVRERTIE